MAWLAPTYQQSERDLDSTLPCFLAQTGRLRLDPLQPLAFPFFRLRRTADREAVPFALERRRFFWDRCFMVALVRGLSFQG